MSAGDSPSKERIQQLASRGQAFARNSLQFINESVSDLHIQERVSQGVQELEIQQKLSDSKKRISQGVQNLELQQRYTDSKERLSQRVKKLELQQRLNDSTEKMKAMKLGQKIGGAASMFGQSLQKLNLAKAIDQMEHDQELADSLERKNQDIQEEAQAREMMREAEAACTEAMESHLTDFLQEHPNATYEEWIADLHPENFHEGKLLEGLKELDHRFYVQESDHRRLWNKNLGEGRTEVHARSQMWREHNSGPQVDLLDSISNDAPANAADSKQTDQENRINESDPFDIFSVPLSSSAEEARRSPSAATSNRNQELSTQQAKEVDFDLLDFTR